MSYMRPIGDPVLLEVEVAMTDGVLPLRVLLLAELAPLLLWPRLAFCLELAPPLELNQQAAREVDGILVGLGGALGYVDVLDFKRFD